MLHIPITGVVVRGITTQDIIIAIVKQSDDCLVTLC